MRTFAVLVVIGLVTLGYASITDAGRPDETNSSRSAAVTDISVSGNPGPLIVNSASAGFEPSAESDATTTYSISTDPGTMKIVGSIDGAMPSNTLLYITLAAPTGASSTGWQTLSTSPMNLVTSIDDANEVGLTVSYRLEASVTAGVIASAQKTVTLTVSAQ